MAKKTKETKKTATAAKKASAKTKAPAKKLAVKKTAPKKTVNYFSPNLKSAYLCIEYYIILIKRKVASVMLAT